jgi:hypothetical protein
MKYLKKIFESNNFNSMTDEELEEKLHWLRTEYAEIGREISQVVSIQKSRKESSEEELIKDWPKSIWDLDKFQLSWVLEHGHHTTSKHYQISHEYLGQLEGVLDSGFSADTNQYIFTICMNSWVTDDLSYNSNDEGIKSIKFLHKNLKKVNFDGQEATRFNILFSNISDDYNLFYCDDKVILKSGRYQKEYKSIEEAIKALAKKDIDDSDY